MAKQTEFVAAAGDTIVLKTPGGKEPIKIDIVEIRAGKLIKPATVKIKLYGSGVLGSE
jgi:hypothetical protein